MKALLESQIATCPSLTISWFKQVTGLTVFQRLKVESDNAYRDKLNKGLCCRGAIKRKLIHFETGVGVAFRRKSASAL